MQKSSKMPIPLTRSERKAANTDKWVKEHLDKIRLEDDLKKSRLQALRAARDADIPQKESDL